MIVLLFAMLASTAAFIGMILLTQYFVHKIGGRNILRDLEPPKQLDQSIRTVIDFQQVRKAKHDKN